MKIEWTVRSLADLETIGEFISREDPNAARKLVNGILDSTETMLVGHPNAGRQGRVENTREWVAHKNYVVAYRVIGERIQVLTVMHSARL